MTTTLSGTILGTSDLTNYNIDIAQLSNGELFVLQYQQTSSDPPSKIEFLNSTPTSITNVTSLAAISLPSNLDSTVLVNELYVGGNLLPDIVLADGGFDQAPWAGGQVRIIAPNAHGQYVDETSALPQVTAYNHRLSTGLIDGQAAIVVAQIGNQSKLPTGVELIIANSDGTFTNWTSHIPASVQNSNIYTYDVIGNFADNSGDIFLGSENATVNPNVLLINDGSGNFTAETLNTPIPQLFKTGELDHNGYPAQMSVVYALPTKFAGDNHVDLIAVYANSAASSYGGSDSTEQAYYLQFLQGNGSGGFSDVTSQHLANQPILLNVSGQNAWVDDIQQVKINGFNDLIVFAANGAPQILINDGQDHYTLSSAQVPTNLAAATWGTDAGVQGFYGLNTSSQWVFIPVSASSLAENTSSISSPLASQIYLYGAHANAASLAQSYDTTITVTLHGAYSSTGSANDAVTLSANGQTLGSQSLAQTYGFTYQGNQYTTEQTLTFTVHGTTSINSLQISGSALSSLFVTDINVGGTDLGAQNSWNSNTDTIVLTAYASAQASGAAVGTSADPIQVTGGGGNSAAFVLGNHTQYTETGVGTSTIHLSESAGLNQNAILTNVSYVIFQDGDVLNTQTGAWGSTTVSESVSQLASAPSYATTINVSDTAANVTANLDSLEQYAAAGALGKVTLTDGGIPTITVSAAQLTADAVALKAIGGNFNTVVDLPSVSTTIHGGVSGLGTVADINGNSSSYKITAAGDGADFTITGNGAAYSLNGITEVQFSDTSLIVSSQTAGHGAQVSSAQITELYGAVFGRLPDAGGLAYYEQSALNNPGTSFVTYAENFLSSPEYANNSAHGYAPTAAGDTQFITDSYKNLLGRAPASGDAAWYEANVIAPIIASDTAAGATMAQAELHAHAQVLVDFSASAEFTNDVSTTGTGTPAFGGHHWLLLV